MRLGPDSSAVPLVSWAATCATTSQETLIDSRAMALAAAEILDGRQATEICILDVSGRLAIADYFVIVTARNLRHAGALAREVSAGLKAQGCPRLNTAGLEGERGWVLLDFDLVIVHCLIPEAREFYSLESLWADCPVLPFTPAPVVPAAPEAFPGFPQGRNPASFPGIDDPPPEIPGH